MKETKFKETEIGLIPEDWEMKTIAEDFLIIPNNTLSRDNLNYVEGKYCDIHYGDVLIKFKEYIDCQNVTIPYVNCFCDNFNKHTLQSGDIVMADTAEDETVGKVTELYNVGQKKIVSGLHTIPLRPKIKFAPKFLGYSMNFSMYHNQLFALMCGTKVTSVSKSGIKTTKLPYPPLFEQTSIATMLSDIDGLIDSLDSLIEKKQAIKEGAMQQLLTGKKRLEGFNEPWVERKLGDIAEMNSGGTPSTSHPEYYGGNINFLSIGDITNAGKFLNKTEKTITHAGLKNSSAKIFPQDTLMYAMYASLGKCTITQICTAVSQAILGFNLKDEVDVEYLYYYLSSIEEFVKQIGQTGTQSNLSKRIVEEFIIPMPSTKAEQTAIANILSDMDDEIDALKQKRDKYNAIKDGMMQQLLTGKIRLV